MSNIEDVKAELGQTVEKNFTQLEGRLRKTLRNMVQEEVARQLKAAQSDPAVPVAPPSETVAETVPSDQAFLARQKIISQTIAAICDAVHVRAC